MMKNIRVGYLNVYGLTKEKWRVLEKWADDYDLVFLAETWYIDQHQYLGHGLTLASTSSSRVYTEGRQHHGLLCLCSLSLRSLVTQLRVSEFSISVTVLGHTILGVYAPPSMVAVQFGALLRGWTPPSVVIGDINVYFGKRFGDTTSGPSERMLEVQRTTLLFHLQHCRPVVGRTWVDHVLARRDLGPVMSVVEAPVDTNHPLIELNISLPLGVGHVPEGSQGLRRFYLKYLDNVQVVVRMVALYDHVAAGIEALVCSAIDELRGFSPEDRQVLVNDVDKAILTAVTMVASACLGTYQVAEARRRRDRMPERLENAESVLAAIRLYKRGFRVQNTQVWVESRDPLKTPMVDAVDFYTEIFSQPNPAWRPENLRGEHFFAVGDAEISGLFDTDSVQELIERYPADKSCGSDSAHVRLLGALKGSKFALHLSLLYQLCGLTGLTPERWNESIISPIPKKVNQGPISVFRPIALTQMFRRIFEMGLLRFFKKYDPLSQLHSTQAGFRHGFSTVTHALVSHEGAVIQSQHQGFVDFRMAYDTVPVPLLLEKLERRGVSMGILSLISALFLRCSSRVVVNSLLSEPFQRSRGIFQGSILAPMLFDVFIDDLAVDLDGIARWDPAPHSLLFADDVKVGHQEAETLQYMFDVVGVWAVGNGMTVNIPKSAVITWSDQDFYIQGETLPKVSCYTYLGLPHHRREIAWEDHLQMSVEKAKRHLSSIYDISQGWPAWVRLSIYRTFIRPQFEYALAVTFHVLDLQEREAFQDAQAFHNSCLAWIVGVRNRTALARSLTGLPSLWDRMYALAVGFYKHLKNMHPDNPATKVLTWYHSHIPWPSSSLLPRAALNSLLRHLPHLSPQPPRTSVTLKERIYAFQLKQLSSSIGLASYVLPSCRRTSAFMHSSGNVGADWCLFLTDAQVRQYALSWRCNTFGHHRQCQCGEFFNRRHVSACKLFENASFISSQQLATFGTDLVQCPWLQDSTYCILDSLLNHRQYDTFEDAMTYLVMLLT